MSTTSNTNDNKTSDATSTTPLSGEVTDLTPRKMNETFDTEDDDSSDDASQPEQQQESGDDEDDEEYEVQDAAVDILDQLVELFIEKNGREPNEQEVLQWIEVFKSLEINDGDEEEPTNEEEAETAAVASE